MSLNTIELKPQMLADFYKDTLIETDTTSVPSKEEKKFLGGNAKQILIVVTHEEISFLPDNELAFLTTILAACKLSVADIAIINKKKIGEEELQTLIDAEAKNVLLFGIEPLSIGLPINFPPFQLQQFNKRTYLHAPTLSELEKDKTLKTKLWTSLKTLFGI